MHITLESDYAIRIVIFLAKLDKRADAKQIAENTGVSLRFALKILRKLVASEIVMSYKGSKGGYQIAKNIDKISLKDIIEVVEGDYCLSRCLIKGCECTNPEKLPCKVKSAFNDISMVVRKKLKSIKVSDLIK
jgi:Rrf2 family protein